MSLYDKWQALAEETGRAVQAQLAQHITAYKNMVCEILFADARHFSRSGEWDEAAYEQLVYLMETYAQCAALIETAAEPNPPAEELLAGVYDIVQSRRREYEETAMPVSGKNPVTEEKSVVIERALLYTLRQIENTAEQLFGKLHPGKQEALRRAFLLADEEDWQNQLSAILTETVHTEIYTHYRDGLRFCLVGLDDLHGRKVASLYTERIIREWEVLHDLVCLPLDTAAETTATAAFNPDAPTVFTSDSPTAHLFTLLREAYEKITPLADELQRLPRENTNRPAQSRTAEAFAEALNTEALNTIAIEPLYTTELPAAAPFYEALTESTETLFAAQRIVFLKAAYRLQRMVGDEILLAEEAVNIFKRAHADLTENVVEAPPQEIQILQGIAETLEIKTNSLKESISDFNGESASLFQAFAKEKNDVTDEIKIAAYPLIRKAWLTEPPASAEDAETFFNRCCEIEPFASARADYEKHVARYHEKTEKAALRFRKEVLLYEIATYEEILTHSVSRLFASENPMVQAAAAQLEETYNTLEILLKKNNVTTIRPMPHDPFNGREHDVLVAEKQEGFQKGEIIKRLGSGYRYKDMVLVRANVVAAK
jgi:molecular chaperone GrpE (heat shock protein)